MFLLKSRIARDAGNTLIYFHGLRSKPGWSTCPASLDWPLPVLSEAAGYRQWLINHSQRSWPVLKRGISTTYKSNIEKAAINNVFKNKSKIYLISSILIMYWIFYIILVYNNNINEIQNRVFIAPKIIYDILSISLYVGYDGINLFLLFLIVIIIPIILIIRERSYTSVQRTPTIDNNSALRTKQYETKGKRHSIAVEKDNKSFDLIIVILEIILLGIFLTFDLIIFYILFEIILIPMFYIIIVYNKKYKRIEASYKLFIYTILGSFFFIINIIIIYMIYGSFNIELLEIYFSFEKFNLKSIIWVCFFITFAIKIPMFPFHLWLPEAHTEAPTTGSVILAAIILKVGTYGFIKFNLILLGSFINYYYSPIIYLFSILSIIYSNFLILRLIDIKKIIAYSSIIHMNYAMLALFSEDINSLIGTYYTLISHGLVSSALFLLIGVLYRRYSTRNILYFKGLFSLMPIFSIVLMYFIISNMSLPLTPAFPGEFLILLGVNKNSILISILISFFLIFSTSYNILLLNKILFGQVSSFLLKFKDLSLNEFFSFFPLIILSFVFSIFCYPIINNIFLFISYILI